MQYSCFPACRHNLRLLELFGFKPHPVQMRIAFGTGDSQWTNHSPSQLTDRCEGVLSSAASSESASRAAHAAALLCPSNPSWLSLEKHHHCCV